MVRRSVLYAFFFCLLLTAMPARAEIKWLTLEEGRSRAAAEQKPMIVDFFYGKGCPRCEEMEKKLYENRDIAEKISAAFIPVRVSLKKRLTEEEAALGNLYNFRNDCLLLFLDHEGNIIKDPGGKELRFMRIIEPEQFKQYLDMIEDRYKPHKRQLLP